MKNRTRRMLAAKTIRTCAELVGCDAVSPRMLSVREAVSVQAIYMRRMRFERRFGVTLPRGTRRGRPATARTPGNLSRSEVETMLRGALACG